MAKTMIEQIREAEAKGQEIVSLAQQAARETEKGAAAKAAELTALSVKQADSDAAGIIKDAETAAVEIKETAVRKGWAEGEKLSARADKARAEAVEAAIREIFA